MTRPRGKCRRCFRTLALDKAGNLGRHAEPGFVAHDCPGAGLPPMGTETKGTGAMDCELQNENCRGDVHTRAIDGKPLCWTHWKHDLPEPTQLAPHPRPATAQENARAASAIRLAIHERDGIVMGRDPLGNLCRCGCNDPLPGDRGAE